MFLGNVFVHCFNQESTNLFIFLIVNNTWIVLSQWDILLVKVFYLTSKSLKMGYYSVYYANFKQKTDIFQMFHHLLIIVSWSGMWNALVWCALFMYKNINMCIWLLNCFVQNPDIVLVHYLNIPYQDNTKVKIPVVPPYTLEKKEWTKEELVDQLRPMCECHSSPCVL